MESALLVRTTLEMQQRYVSLSYRFQEVRFRFMRSLVTLQETRRWRNPALPELEPPDFPVYVYSKKGNSAFAMREAPHLAGGAAAPLLRCWTENGSEESIVHAEGEVDLSNASSFQETIETAFAANPRVIVDLTKLAYLDGSGIHVLEGVSGQHPGRFAIVGSNARIHKLFDILQLNDVLPVFPTVQQAEGYLRR